MMKTSVTFRRRQLSCSTSVAALLLAGAVIAGMPTAAQANDWTGVVSNDWFTAGNWSTNAAVPTAADDVVIDTTTPNPTSISGVMRLPPPCLSATPGLARCKFRTAEFLPYPVRLSA